MTPPAHPGSGASLSGLRVLVTRPAHQAQALCRAIEEAGGHALRQPLLAIREPRDPEQARAVLGQVEQGHELIFTSTNAVSRAWQLRPDWQPQGLAYAVGRATAQALAEQMPALEVRLPKNDFSSEGLLALPSLAGPPARSICLITGEQGRNTLYETLRERGFDVHVATVYRREPMAVEPARLQALLGEVDVIFVSSGESLQHLYNASVRGLRRQLLGMQLVVPSARVVKLARELGFSRPALQPSRMQDDAVVAKLLQWVNLRQRPPAATESRPGNWE